MEGRGNGKLETENLNPITEDQKPKTKDQRPGTGRRWTIWLVIAAVVLALIASFVTQNYETVEVRLLFWSVNVRLAWAVILALLIGALLGWLLPRRWRRLPRLRSEGEVTRDPAG